MSHEYHFVENYSQIAHKNRKWNLSKCQGRGMWGGQIFFIEFLGASNNSKMKIVQKSFSKKNFKSQAQRSTNAFGVLSRIILLGY